MWRCMQDHVDTHHTGIVAAEGGSTCTCANLIVVQADRRTAVARLADPRVRPKGAESLTELERAAVRAAIVAAVVGAIARARVKRAVVVNVAELPRLQRWWRR